MVEGQAFNRLWSQAEAESAKRAADMPTEQDAINTMNRAYHRLKELGWNDAIYCPKDGSTFDAIEVGSTGIHSCHYEGRWPNGGWWVDGEWPSRPALYRPNEAEIARRAAFRAQPHPNPGGIMTQTDDRIEHVGYVEGNPDGPAYEAARTRLADALRSTGRTSYEEMAEELLEGDLIRVPTWLVLQMLSAPTCNKTFQAPSLPLLDELEAVTQDQVYHFLEEAFRNVDMPTLDTANIEEIRIALQEFSDNCVALARKGIGEEG